MIIPFLLPWAKHNLYNFVKAVKTESYANVLPGHSSAPGIWKLCGCVTGEEIRKDTRAIPASPVSGKERPCLSKRSTLPFVSEVVLETEGVNRSEARGKGDKSIIYSQWI